MGIYVYRCHSHQLGGVTGDVSLCIDSLISMMFTAPLKTSCGLRTRLLILGSSSNSSHSLATSNILIRRNQGVFLSDYTMHRTEVSLRKIETLAAVLFSPECPDFGKEVGTAAPSLIVSCILRARSNHTRTGVNAQIETNTKVRNLLTSSERRDVRKPRKELNSNVGVLTAPLDRDGDRLST